MKNSVKTGLLVLLAIVVIFWLTPAVNFPSKRHPTKVSGVNNITHLEFPEVTLSKASEINGIAQEKFPLIPVSETNPPAKP